MQIVISKIHALFRNRVNRAMRILLSALLLALMAACGSETSDSEAPKADPATSQAAESGAAHSAASTEPVRLVVYTSRQPHLIEPLFDRYTDETGVDIAYINDSEAALIERLDAEEDQT